MIIQANQTNIDCNNDKFCTTEKKFNLDILRVEDLHITKSNMKIVHQKFP